MKAWNSKPVANPGHASRWLLAALLLLTAAAVLAGRAPYLHDFGEWLYQAQIVKDLLTGETMGDGFQLAAYPVPNSLATLLLAALSALLPPLWAGKVFLLLLLGGWYVVIRVFARRYLPPVGRDGVALVLFALAALSTFFWYGFISYQLGLLLLAAFLAINRETTSPCIIATFALALFFAHAMTFLVFGLFIACRLLFNWQWKIVAALVPSGLISLWYLAGRHLADAAVPPVNAQWSGWMEALLYKAAYPAMIGPFRNLLLPDGSGPLDQWPLLYRTGAAVNFAVSAGLAVFLVSALWRGMRLHAGETPGKVANRRALATTLLLLGLAYAFGPYHFFGLINPGGRLLLPLLMFALMLDGAAFAARPWIVWPIAVTALLSSGLYLALMLQARSPEFETRAPPRPPGAADLSVFEYNERLNRSSRYRYFNYRVFAFADRFERIEASDYGEPAFHTGLLIRQDK
jgi:hypothetical protein